MLHTKGSIIPLALLATLTLATTARAQGGVLEATLIGYEEVPAVSTQGKGKFDATLSADENTIEWTLSWHGKLSSDVAQAHIHFAQPGVHGGIVLFFCTDLGNGPVGTPTCPASPANLAGDFVKADVGGGADSQGIAAGQFRELVKAIKTGNAYVNVHTATFANGEIRGQVDFTPAP